MGSKVMIEPSTLKSPSVAPKAERGYALAASDCRLLSVEGLLGVSEEIRHRHGMEHGMWSTAHRWLYSAYVRVALVEYVLGLHVRTAQSTSRLSLGLGRKWLQMNK